MEQIFLSQDGLNIFRKQIENVDEQLKALREEKNHAYTASGDQWHDNPYFNKLEQDEHRKASELATLSAMLKSAKVYSVPNIRPTETVTLCSIIKILRHEEKTGKTEENIWEIVGYGETNLSAHKLAYNTPIAKAILGREAGDELSVQTPGGKVTIEICELYPNWDTTGLLMEKKDLSDTAGISRPSSRKSNGGFSPS